MLSALAQNTRRTTLTMSTIPKVLEKRYQKLNATISRKLLLVSRITAYNTSLIANFATNSPLDLHFMRINRIFNVKCLKAFINQPNTAKSCFTQQLQTTCWAFCYRLFDWITPGKHRLFGGMGTELLFIINRCWYFRHCKRFYVYLRLFVIFSPISYFLSLSYFSIRSHYI